MQDDTEQLRRRVQYRSGWTTMADILKDHPGDNDT